MLIPRLDILVRRTSGDGVLGIRLKVAGSEVVVSNVEPRSDGEASGIKVGDIVYSISRQRIPTPINSRLPDLTGQLLRVRRPVTAIVVSRRIGPNDPIPGGHRSSDGRHRNAVHRRPQSAQGRRTPTAGPTPSHPSLTVGPTRSCIARAPSLPLRSPGRRPKTAPEQARRPRPRQNKNEQTEQQLVTQTLPTPCANEGGGAGAEVVVVVVEEEEEKKIKLINSARTTVLGLACRALQLRFPTLFRLITELAYGVPAWVSWNERHPAWLGWTAADLCVIQAFYEDDIDGFKAALGRPRQFDVRRQLPSGASLLDLARQMSSSCSQFLMTREKAEPYTFYCLTHAHRVAPDSERDTGLHGEGGNCNGKGDGNGAAGAGDSADANGDARGSGNLDAADTAPPTEYPPGQVCSFCKSEAIEGGDGNERWRVTSLQIDPSMSRWPFLVCEACATAAKAATDAATPPSSQATAALPGWAEYYAALDEPMWLDGMMLHKSETRHGSIVTQMVHPALGWIGH